MQLTIFTDYGLRVLMYLGERPGQLASVREIADHYAVSRHHLVKVTHRLSQLGYLATSKGKGGGICLAADPAELKLGDIVRKLEANLHIVECFDQETNTCNVINSCKLKHMLFEAKDAFLRTLDKYTLADTLTSRKSFGTTPD